MLSHSNFRGIFQTPEGYHRVKWIGYLPPKLLWQNVSKMGPRPKRSLPSHSLSNGWSQDSRPGIVVSNRDTETRIQENEYTVCLKLCKNTGCLRQMVQTKRATWGVLHYSSPGALIDSQPPARLIYLWDCLSHRIVSPYWAHVTSYSAE